MEPLIFIKPEHINELHSENPRARIWKYRMNVEPLVKKILKFSISYSEVEVKRYLKGEGITNVTLWPAFKDEPPIPKVEGYGVCPTCMKPGISRERRPDGNDRCMSGHTYPSKSAIHR